MKLAIDHHHGRTAFLAQLEALTSYASSLDDEQLLAPSRCRGWLVGDVLVHSQLGLQEMFVGLASGTALAPDRDAASYWQTQPPVAEFGPDQFAHLNYVRTLFSALRRPSALLEQWRAAASGLSRAVGNASAGVLEFQGFRLSTGDFLASWAVELAVHHLDLRPAGSDLPVAVPAPDALRLARRTIEALLAAELPVGWSDERVVLLGTGRVSPGAAELEALEGLADQLPVLG